MKRTLHKKIKDAERVAANLGVPFKDVCNECGLPTRTFRRWKRRELRHPDDYQEAKGDNQREQLLDNWLEENDCIECQPDKEDYNPNTKHTSTITKKANKWWEAKDAELTREFENLEQINVRLPSNNDSEDWVTHVTDLHAGDLVKREDGEVVYSTDEVPQVIDYITKQSLRLAEKHNSNYDAAHLLWGGDFVTGEAIYESQWEDLDGLLDEQHDVLVDPLMRQIKAFSERFEVVQIVTQVGNHGEFRANGASRQANVDLILYKTIRNIIAQLQSNAGILENVQIKIGEVRPFRNFPMRGGKLRGHLRHGQNRKPQAETSARLKQWLSTLMDHEFDAAFAGHHHVSGRVPWDGPPVIFSGSAKPTGELVERMGEKTPSRNRDIATAAGFSDEGITCIYPIDNRYYGEEQ